MSTLNAPRSTVAIEDFGIFLDLRDQGYNDVIGGTLFTEDDANSDPISYLVLASHSTMYQGCLP